MGGKKGEELCVEKGIECMIKKKEPLDMGGRRRKYIFPACGAMQARLKLK
jgi:hypothetical protein